MVGHTRAEPGCERYDLYAAADGAPLHLLERYANREALEAHRATEHYLEYRRRVVDLIEGGVDVVVLDGLDVAP
jgi:quinol monooxygenase YgiN